MKIEMPDPVITTEITYIGKPWVSEEFMVAVQVGGVTVMQHTYTRDYACRGQANFVYDESDGTARSLARFGEALANLFERSNLA